MPKEARKLRAPAAKPVVRAFLEVADNVAQHFGPCEEKQNVQMVGLGVDFDRETAEAFERAAQRSLATQRAGIPILGSGTNTRAMAEEAGCLDLYRFAYTPFSEATHSMWFHVSVHNLKRCANPLHRYHSVPHAPQIMPQFYYLHMAAKYLKMTLTQFDEKVGVLGVSADLWLGLQQDWDLWHAMHSREAAEIEQLVPLRQQA